MMSEDRDVSIIIVSWNVKEFLKRCLGSVYRFTEGVNLEVFVVDNHSLDESPEMVKRDFPAVRLIENRENRGFSAANNEALSRASGRYVLLLNPDTELVDNACKKMMDFMDSRKDADGLGCRLISGDGRLQPSCRHFPSVFTDIMETFYLDSLFPRSGFFNYYRMGSWDHKGTRRVDVVYGACFMVRREIFSRIGLLDEGLFMYYDEIDLCYRIKRAGGSIYFTDDVTVIHYANKSSSQDSTACERYKDASRLRFFAKHYGIYSVYFLMLDLAIQTFLVWVLGGVSHLIFRRPRDLDYIKRPIRIMWGEHMRFIAAKR